MSFNVTRNAMLLAVAINIPTTQAGLNDTGITTCSNIDTNGLTCPVAGFPGQDAEYGTNKFNFTKLDANGKALPAEATNHTCVRDNVTGLTWEVKTDDGGLRDKDNTYTFDQAAQFASAVNTGGGLCGFTDWRVPHMQELTGIVDRSIAYPGPTIATSYFPNTVATQFWSATSLVASAGYAWNVLFDYGYDSYNLVGSNYAVRMVRGTSSAPVLADNGDGTVTDSSTGLMWAKCAVGKSGSDCATVSTSSQIWGTALTTAQNATLAGYSDWRLPNVQELRSLVDYSRYEPSINTTRFPNTDAYWFWSSSPVAYGTALAWVVGFGNGNAFNSYRSNHNPVRLVRAGQPFAPFALRVSKLGSGSGAVTSIPTGINCGEVCSVLLTSGTDVTLTATAQAGSGFAGWGGACSGVATTCNLTMDTAKEVTATFNLNPPPQYTLNILHTGSGTGTITSTPAGINCGNQCAASYNSGDTITLTATAKADSTFGGWTGAECNGIGTCTLQLTASSADQTIAANFETNTPQNLGTTWTTPTSPTTATIKAIIWRDNLHDRQVPGLIAVSTKGEVLTSLEGNSWIARNIDNTAQLNALAWTGTTLVAAGGAGNTARIYTSVDAITWQSVPLNGQTLHALLWNPFLSQLLAVSAAGKIYSSDANGQNWTAVTSPTQQTLHAIANNATRNVAVGLAGTIITSTDGNIWTLSTSNTQADLYTVLWNGYQFLAAGDKVVLTSPDGLTWTNLPTTFTFYNVEWNGSRYFAVGPNGILSSVTGHTWTTVYTSAKPLQDIVWTGSQLLAGGDNGLIARANGATNQNATALQVSYDPDQTINIIIETTATNRTPTGVITIAANGVTKARLYHNRPEYGLRYQGKVNGGDEILVEYHGDEAFEPSQAYITIPAGADLLHKNTATADNATLQAHVIGKGTVTTPLARWQINCDGDCAQIYNRTRAASVTLRATPNPGHTFTGWSGGCSGSADTCTIIMNTAQDVTATFASSGAATAPNVNTDPPSNVTITYATLKGWVNDNGADTTAAFDFGTTPDYGTKLDAVPKTIKANTGATSITASKPELRCATTYHYRATATNGKGTINAPGVSFTTSPCPGVKRNTVKIIGQVANGTINPVERQVPDKGHATFTATANTGYTHSLKVTGTCPMGFWHGDIWTTGAITKACQVGFTFSPLGDANGDDKINSLDLKAAARQILGITPAGNADCNEDNIVDARDVVCVAHKMGKP